MKYRSLLSLSLILSSITIAGAWLLLPEHEGMRHAALEEREAMEGEEAENPGELAHWEWQRLHDPKSGKIPDGIRTRELAFAAKIPGGESFAAKRGMADASAEWEPRGPFNVGGRTRALAVDVTSSSTILAGAATGGMWRSTDGGGSWTRTTRPEQHPGVSCLAQDVREGHTAVWYYGTGEYYGSTASIDQAKYSGDGIYKSIDGGRSWELLPATHTGSPTELDNAFEYVWNVQTDPSNTAQEEVYAAVYGGVKRSTDGGQTWANVLGGFESGGAFTDVAVTASGVVYATMSSDRQQHGIWRSADGVNWKEITPAGFASTFNRVVIGVAPSNPDVVYFLGETPNSGIRVGGASGGYEWHSLWKYTYRSGDGSGGGGTWESRSQGLPGTNGLFGGYKSQRSYDMVIEVKPDDEHVVFIGGTNLYRSTNGFQTSAMTTWIGGYKNEFLWLDFSYPNHHPDQHALAFDPNNSAILYSGNDGGIQRTMNAAATDGIVWESLNRGYQTTQLYALAIDHATPGDRTIIAGMQDNSSWMTRGAGATDPWMQVGPGDGAYCAIADSGAAYYISSQGGRIYRVGFETSGEIAGFTRIDPSGGPAYLFVNPFALDPADNHVIYHLSGSSVWRNTNPLGFPLDSSNTAKTVNWTKVNLSGSGLNTLTAIGVSRTNPAHRIWIGTIDGDVAVLDDANKLTTSPRFVSGTLDGDGGYVSCVAVDPDDGNKAMVVFSNYNVRSLYYTTDGGNSWSDVSGNLEEHPDGTGDGPSCRWAAVLHRKDGDIFYVGTSTGLYSTTKLQGAATVWVQEGASMIGNAVVDMVDVRQVDGFVAVGTHGNGVYTATLGSAAVPHEDRYAASVLRVDGIAPNPVRASGTIAFTLGVPATVRVSIFDMAGREVLRPIDGERMPAGAHAATVNARDERSGALPAGLYYYQVEAAGERRGGKIVVE